MEYRKIESAIALGWSGTRVKTATKNSAAAFSDEDIIELVRDGDTEAFGRLVTRYENFVFTLVKGMVRSEEAARDIAQETFLRAYRGIRRFELRAGFRTWLYRIAHNTALSYLDREKRGSGESEPMEPSYAPNQPLRLKLENLIGRLKPEYRAVIMFYYFDDLKYEEIAETLDCPIGTVKIRLYRAKYELKKLWERYEL